MSGVLQKELGAEIARTEIVRLDVLRRVGKVAGENQTD